MRAKRITYNSIAQFIYITTQVISGLILPRLILTYFGSDYNGVIGSITQFLGYISLLTAGVGGVTRAALYKPLVEHDNEKISGIMRATEFFMRKVALIFICVLVGIAALYPYLVSDEFDWFFVFTLTLILGADVFIQYFFGITYTMLIFADQRAYVTALVRTCTIILNAVIAVILIITGHDIRVVQLVSTTVYAINPVFIYCYARRRYKIDQSAKPDNSAIKQRWDAFAHQVADFVNTNVGIIILTLFAGILEVAVYVIYILIVRKIRLFVVSLTGTGMEAALGNMIANDEHKSLQKGLQLYEFANNSLTTFLVTCTVVLIVPFVSVYTLGVDDVDYYRPLFAFLACAAEFFDIARIPYQSVVYAAGHFRQTRTAAFIEMGINIILSVVLVQWFGLIGVITGLLCAFLFRTTMFAVHVSRHIVKRSLWVFIRRMLVSLLTAGVIITFTQLLPKMVAVSYTAWILYALPVAGVAAAVTALSSFVFYREEARMLINKMRSLLVK